MLTVLFIYYVLSRFNANCTIHLLSFPDLMLTALFIYYILSRFDANCTIHLHLLCLYSFITIVQDALT